MATAPFSVTAVSGASKHPTAGAAGVLPRSRKSAHLTEAPVRPSHHEESGRGFRNPWPSYREYGPWDFLTRVLPQTRRTETYELPRVLPDWAALQRPREALQTMWIGHATFLVQAHGWNMLTDPVFSLRASPTQWMGPARHTPPACAIPDLPPIHIVMLSHNHYDHIDADSIAALVAKEATDLKAAAAGAAAVDAVVDAGFPVACATTATAAATTAPAAAAAARWSHHRPYTGTLYICPAGVSPLLVDLGVAPSNIMELDWWQSVKPGACADPVGAPTLSPLAADAVVTSIEPVDEATAVAGGRTPMPPRAAVAPSRTAWPRITCVPAQHQSARTAFDRNTTLWCGYAVHVGDGEAPFAMPPGPLPPATTMTTAAPPPPPADNTVSLYFTGDTGYRSIPQGVAPLSPEEAVQPRCPAFAQIGQTLGPFDLGCLPIGAYAPRWFMSSFHASPEDAVEMHLDARVRRSVGMHWGSFTLTDEPIEEPLARTAAAKAHHGVADGAFIPVKTGGIVTASGGALHPYHCAVMTERGATIQAKQRGDGGAS